MAVQNNKKEEKPTKFERVYEDEDTISIWKYDTSKSTTGPMRLR